MMTDLPEPSKRPFGHPLTDACLPYFVHPGGDADYEKPFLHHGTVHVCNRWLAIRFDALPTAGVVEMPAMSERMEKVPWANLEAFPDDSPRWSLLDDAPLFRFGARPIWERSRSLYHPRLIPAVGVGQDAVAPLAMVQLLARLPKARVWTDNRREDPVYCRFNGGCAILSAFADYTNLTILPCFRILRPKQDAQTGRPDFNGFKKYVPPVDPKAPPAQHQDLHYDDLPIFIQPD